MPRAAGGSTEPRGPLGPPNSGNENTLAAVGRTPPTTATLHRAAAAGPASRATAARRRSRPHIIVGREMQHGSRAAPARERARFNSHAAGRKESPLGLSWPPETTTRSPHSPPHMREPKPGPPIKHGTQRTREQAGGPYLFLSTHTRRRGRRPHVRTVGRKGTAHTFAFSWPPKKEHNQTRRFGTRGCCVPALLGLPKGRQRRRRWASPDVNAPTPRPIDAPHFRAVTLARARHFRRRCCFRHSRCMPLSIYVDDMGDMGSASQL
ncbi:hypothetical protein MRX96_017900 [Rhipicephalus microplus]